MNLPTFITTYTGEAVDVDGVAADIGQCVQLVALYCQKVLGTTLPDVRGAVDLWTNTEVLAEFTQITAGNEQAGDIAAWGASSLINSPTYGHTDIVISHGFNGFDSNWGNVNNAQGQPIAHQVEHTYQDVLGFLRFRQGGVTMNTPPVNEGDIINMCNLGNWSPGETYINTCNGSDWKKFMYDLTSQPGFQAALQAKYGQPTNPTILAPGDYRVQ
jgi:hypothetical protein